MPPRVAGFHRLQPTSRDSVWPRVAYLAVAGQHEARGRRKDSRPVVVHVIFEVCKPKPEQWECTYLPEFADGELFPTLYDDLARFAGKRQPVIVVMQEPSREVVEAGLIPGLLARGFVAQSAADGHLPFIIPMSKASTNPKRPHRMTLTALGNLYPAELDELAARVNLPAPQPDGLAHDTAIRSARILAATIAQHRELILAEQLGAMALTRSGQAMNAYRRRFMEHEIFIHKNPKVQPLERAAYYGGRTEMFYCGKARGRIHRVDVNSMYVSVMADALMPRKLLTYRHFNLAPEDIAYDLAQGYALVADVLIETDIPLYPYNDPVSGRTTFPVGRFRTTLATPELIEASTREHIRAVHALALYEQAPIFRTYAAYVYERRREAKAAGDALQAELFKLMGNGLYGKFAQRSFPWVRMGDVDPEVVQCAIEYDVDTGETVEHRMYGGSDFAKDPTPQEAINSFPAIAATVASAARIRLWRMMEIAGREHVLYVDTDALMVDDIGFANLQAAGMLDASRLGALKVEDSSSSVIIYANKDYRFGNKLVVKGIPDERHGWVIDEEGNRASGWLHPSLVTAIREGNLTSYSQRLTSRPLHRIDGRHGWQTPRMLAAD